MCDIVNDKLAENRKGNSYRWMAFRLIDGDGDRELYDSYEAVRRHNPDRCLYVRLTPDGMKPRAAQALLQFHRGLYERGLRFGDPTMPAPEPTLANQELPRPMFPPPGLWLPGDDDD
jgi:hypothetical protein